MSDISPIRSDSILVRFFEINNNFNLDECNLFDKDYLENLTWVDKNKGIDLDKNKDIICDRLKAYKRLLYLGLSAEEAKRQLDPEPHIYCQDSKREKLR